MWKILRVKCVCPSSLGAELSQLVMQCDAEMLNVSCWWWPIVTLRVQPFLNSIHYIRQKHRKYGQHFTYVHE